MRVLAGGPVLALRFLRRPRPHDSYPSRPIKLLIPFPPAGITDLSGRIVAEGLRAKFNQPVVVENKPGANGVIGLRELLKAEPDGYTLMVGNVGSLVLNYAMDSKAPFDPMKDVVPIAGTAEYATTMVVNKNLPVNSVKEFIAYAKARQGQLTYGSTGEGSIANLVDPAVHEADRREDGARALQGRAAGAQRPDRGPHPAHHRGVAGGERAGARRHHQGLRRSAAPIASRCCPNVPTFEEAGVPGVVVTGWLGIYGPPGLPNDVREKLGAAIVEVVKHPETQDKLRAIGFEPTGQGVQEFTAHHAAEVKRWVAFYSEVGLRK